MILTWVDNQGEFVLDDSNGIDVQEGVTGLDMPPVSTSWEPRATFDGAAVANERFDPRQIILPIFFYDEVNARDRIAVFARRLLNAGRTGGELRLTQFGRTRSLFEVRRTAGLEGLETPLSNWRRQIVELTAGDPWWRGPQQSNPLNFNIETPFDDPTVPFDDVNTPFDGGDTTPFFVDGDTSAYPQLFITGPFTEVSITNTITGQSIQTDTAIAAGEVLIVDSRPTSRGPRFQGDDRPDWSLITAPSRLFELQAGGNVLAVGASGDGVGSSVEVRWRPRFATP